MDMSAAIKEAYAHAPANIVYYDTLEINHATFTDSIRVVKDHVNLETAQGLYLACPGIEFSLPETEGGVRGQLRLTIGFLPREAQIALKDASQARNPVTIKYRQYITRGPQAQPDAEIPIPLQVTSITQSHDGITATAMFPDLQNAPFPRRVMTTTDCPGAIV